MKIIEAVLIGGPNDQQQRRLELVHDRKLRKTVPPPVVTVPGGRYVYHRRVFLGERRVEKYIWKPDIEPAHVRFEVTSELLASPQGRRIVRNEARRELEELGAVARVTWFRIDPERKLRPGLRSEEAIARTARGDRLVVVGAEIKAPA